MCPCRLNGFMQCEITNSHYKICDKIHKTSSNESIRYCMLRKSAPGRLLATGRWWCCTINNLVCVCESEWKWHDIQPSMVTHTWNLCSAFNPSKVHTHSSEHTHTMNTPLLWCPHFSQKQTCVYVYVCVCMCACVCGKIADRDKVLGLHFRAYQDATLTHHCVVTKFFNITVSNTVNYKWYSDNVTK